MTGSGNAQIKCYLWVCLWECFWMRLAFESVYSVMYTASPLCPQVDGVSSNPPRARLEWKGWGRRKLLFLLPVCWASTSAFPCLCSRIYIISSLVLSLGLRWGFYWFSWVSSLQMAAVELFSLHNYVSQFLMLNLHYTHILLILFLWRFWLIQCVEYEIIVLQRGSIHGCACLNTDCSGRCTWVGNGDCFGERRWWGWGQRRDN